MNTTKTQIKNYPFMGWDFSELAKAWNLPSEIGDPHMENFIDDPDWKGQDFDGPDENDYYTFNPNYKITGPVFDQCSDYYDTDKVVLIYLDEVLRIGYKKPWKNGYQLPSRVLRKVAKDIRIYLMKLSENSSSYYGPMWEGMSKIESDEELIRIIAGTKLIGWMWD